MYSLPNRPPRRRRRCYHAVLLPGLLALAGCDDGHENHQAQITALSEQDCAVLHATGTITAANPIGCDRLSRLSFSYRTDNDVLMHDGVWVVLDVIAPNAARVAEGLLAMDFYLAKAVPIEYYGADDNSSMADNNSSAFNGRPIAGTSTWSTHAYGAAIDINPVQNPFIDIQADGTARILPTASAHYAVNRLDTRPNKDPRPGMAEAVVELFAREGFFIWGGDWNFPIDYQHFQFGPGAFIRQLAELDYAAGRQRIDHYTGLYGRCLAEAEPSGQTAPNARQGCVEQVLAAMP